MVVQKFEGLEAYVQACGRDVSLLGLSPGAASAYLGGVRLQHVCRAILEDRLDVMQVGIPDGSTRLYVPYRALWRYSLLPGIPFKSSPASRLHPFRSLLLESAPLIDSLRSVLGSGVS